MVRIVVERVGDKVPSYCCMTIAAPPDRSALPTSTNVQYKVGPRRLRSVVKNVFSVLSKIPDWIVQKYLWSACYLIVDVAGVVCVRPPGIPSKESSRLP